MKRPRSPTCTIGLMVMVSQRSRDGRTVKVLISQEEYDALADKKGKYSLDKVESYFTLCEQVLTPRSNPLLAVEDLHLAKQGSMTSEEFHSHVLQIVKDVSFQTKRQRKEPSGMQFSLV